MPKEENNCALLGIISRDFKEICLHFMPQDENNCVLLGIDSHLISKELSSFHALERKQMCTARHKFTCDFKEICLHFMPKNENKCALLGKSSCVISKKLLSFHALGRKQLCIARHKLTRYFKEIVFILCPKTETIVHCQAQIHT